MIDGMKLEFFSPHCSHACKTASKLRGEGKLPAACPTCGSSAVRPVLDRCVRDGREGQLEPWITAQSAADQDALRAQLAKFHASLRVSESAASPSWAAFKCA